MIQLNQKITNHLIIFFSFYLYYLLFKIFNYGQTTKSQQLYALTTKDKVPTHSNHVLLEIGDRILSQEEGEKKMENSPSSHLHSPLQTLLKLKK